MSTSPSKAKPDDTVRPDDETRESSPLEEASTVTLDASASPADEPLSGGLDGTIPAPLMSSCATGDGYLMGYERYEDFYLLGEGGVGIVQACRDPTLGRRVALKYLRPQFSERADFRIRFIREARVMAQLEHPNIVPVHELCTRPDGTVYFTMKRIEGVSLKTVIEKLVQKDAEYEKRFDRARLLDVFRHVCEAISFAHAHGAIHRDLKPENIQIGEFGEVLVLDWGLVKLVGDPTPDSSDRPPLELEFGAGETADLTIEGAVSGTPAYMSPEQADGHKDLDTRTDIYSLGTILYEILSLRKTVSGSTVPEILRHVIQDPCPPPREVVPERRIPRELDAICMKALAKDREERYQTVDELVRDLRRFERGQELSCCHYPLPVRIWKRLRRHPVMTAVGLAIVGTLVFAVCTVTLGNHLRRSQFIAAGNVRYKTACVLYEKLIRVTQELIAIRKKQVLRKETPEERALEKEISGLEQDMESNMREAVILFVQARSRGKLHGLPLQRLVGIFRRRIEYELLKGDYARASGLLKLFQERFGESFDELPIMDRDALLFAQAAIRGDGLLNVESDPQGADLILQALVPDERGILTPRNQCHLGLCPIRDEGIPKGGYLLTVQMPGRPRVLCPVYIAHGAKVNLTVKIPESIPEGMVFVPGGEALIGGPQSRYERLHSEMIPGFFIKKLEVTFAEYLRFWHEEAGSPPDPELMSRIRFRLSERRFFDAWDEHGELLGPLDPSFPVVGLTRVAMERYCAWLTRKTGILHRLPTADEWEKAARGVDGRDFVWGNHFDPAFAHTIEDQARGEQDELWAPVGSHPLDVSVYGVFDMTGNVREMTGSRFPGDSPFHQIKGASLATSRRFAYCAYSSDSSVVPSDVGFRYVIPLE